MLHGVILRFRRTFSHHVVPLFDVFDVQLSNGDCCVSIAIDSVLHRLECLYLFLRELVFHEVKEGKQANPL